MTGLCTAMLGMILIVALPLDNNNGRLAGYYLTQASPTPFVALLSLISSNVAGYTKKTTVAAMFLIGYCVGNIIGMSTIPINGNCPLTSTRSANLSTKRCTSLCSSRGHNHRVLGCLSRHIGVHSLLLRVAEQEEGADSSGTGICAYCESRVSCCLTLYTITYMLTWIGGSI
jgi:hypothetical protein